MPARLAGLAAAGYKHFIVHQMKKYIYTLLATLPFIFLAGCSKEDAPLPVDKGLAGEWVLTSWNDTAPGEDFGVYMELADNGNFTLYEKVVTPAYVRYSGTYTADGSTFSGTYSDGKPLNAVYAYEIDDSGNTLTMTAGGTVEPDVCIYTRTSIPEDVLSAPDATATKAGSEGRRFL